MKGFYKQVGNYKLIKSKLNLLYAKKYIYLLYLKKKCLNYLILEHLLVCTY